VAGTSISLELLPNTLRKFLRGKEHMKFVAIARSWFMDKLNGRQQACIF
jgi:predicted DNA-binding transcriptional regulator AlpA